MSCKGVAAELQVKGSPLNPLDILSCCTWSEEQSNAKSQSLKVDCITSSLFSFFPVIAY